MTLELFNYSTMCKQMIDASRIVSDTWQYLEPFKFVNMFKRIAWNRNV